MIGKTNSSILSGGLPKDLSMFDIHGNPISQTTANCYVISQPGTYQFPLVYGNAIKNGAVNSAAFTRVNNSSNTTDYVNHKDQPIVSPYIENHADCTVHSVEVTVSDTPFTITNVEIVNGGTCRYVKFDVLGIPLNGANSIVSVLDANGIVIWSWLIWMWSDDLHPVTITNNTGIQYNILPVELASKWDKKNEGTLRSWYYQWGRHTPMICSSTYSSELFNENYGTREIDTGEDFPTYGESIQNPQWFYLHSDWVNVFKYNLWDANCSTTGSSDNDTVKTVYDPCPIGFKVPNGNVFSGFHDNDRISASKYASIFPRYEGDTVGVKFTMSGFIEQSSFTINKSTGALFWKSSVANTTSAFSLSFGETNVENDKNHYAARGGTIRPVQE